MCICLLVGLPACLLQAVCVLQVKNWLVSHATSGSHLFCHPPSHCPNGALQATRVALSLKSHMVTPISFEIIAVFQATWSPLSNYHRNFPGRMQDICKSVPPDRSSKMTEQPPTKKTVWRVVAIATEQPVFVSHSSGKQTMVFLFPHILSSIVGCCFFSFSCPASLNYNPLSRAHTCSGKLSLKSANERRGGTLRGAACDILFT